MGKVRAPKTVRREVPIDPLADLVRRTNKLRGAPSAKLAACVRSWWKEHELGAHPPVVGKRIAMLLLAQPRAEPKLAAIALLGHQLGEHLRDTDLPAFAQLFAEGHLTDAIVVDGFSVNVLGTLLEREPGRGEVARVIAGWRDAETAWQRRAACLAFSSLATRSARAVPAVRDRILTLCAGVVWSPDEADQTAVGTVLRALGRVEPAHVETFVRRHARFMSKACVRTSVAGLSPAVRTELLAHHKRATTLPR